MICLLNLNLSGALGDESEKRRFHMSQAPWVVSKAVEDNDRQICPQNHAVIFLVRHSLNSLKGQSINLEWKIVICG